MNGYTPTARFPTRYSLFAFIADHLLTQNKVAKGPNPRKLPRHANYDDSICVYQSPEGLKCAVGCLLDPTEYRADMEGQPITDMLPALSRSGVIADSNGVDHTLGLLEELQEVHDSYETHDWANRLQEIAEHHTFPWTKPA